MEPATLAPALALLAVFTRELLWLTAAAILLSSLDDIAVDLVWLARVAFRPAPPLPPPPDEPGHFAVLVPAWDESAVIGAMLRRFCQTQSHRHFRLFVGTYPNDPATAAAVDAVAGEDARVIRVSTGHPGPTTKADCLNALWRAVGMEETRSGLPFKAVVLHDAEDWVHADALALHDRLIPGLAMVQIPVLPFPDPRSRWISGHYLDEFAETHARDMMVRAVLGAPVPSAGVGTAIARDALVAIAGPADEPFDPTTLTEDYEIGHKLHRLGLPGRMVRVRVAGELVATREYFPATLETALKQKARWLTGIALAGWDRLGWRGSLAARWMLLRDRKGLFTAGVAILAYVAGVLLMVQAAIRVLLGTHAGQPLPPVLPADGKLIALLALNALLLVWRLVMRIAFTSAAHGWMEGLRAAPRAVVANGVNFLAALRAIDRYRGIVEEGRAIAWDKTAHRFPADDGLSAHGAARG